MITAISSAPQGASVQPTQKPAAVVANAAHAANDVPSPAPAEAPAAPVMPGSAAPSVRGHAPSRKPEAGHDMEQMRKNLQEAIARINEMMRDGGRELHFSIDDKLERPIIIVKNQETGEVIRQIPADVVLKVAQSIEDLKGMLHNETV